MPKNQIYDQLMNNDKGLTNYLSYIRKKEKPINILIQYPTFQQRTSFKQNRSIHKKPPQIQVPKYVYLYVKILKQVSLVDNYATKKIFKSILHFLEQFPTMSFLYEVTSAFGKVQKKLSINQAAIMAEATDQMVPLFKKIIQKIEYLKKQSQSKKLMQLGHRIQHLQDMIKYSKGNFCSSDPQICKIFKKFQPDRIQKYMMMEDSITKAQKRFGNFSQNFIKNRQIFSNLNKVYEDIRNHQKQQTA